MAGLGFSSHGSIKLWDPVKILGIINPDPGYQCITCVGHAPSKGRRCRVAIRESNRRLITDTLNDISYLDPCDPIVISRLRNIAGAALCVRWHQGQASDILSQWRGKLPKTQQRDSGSRKTSTRASGRSQTSKDLQEQLRRLRELMDEVEENLRAEQSESCTEEESEETVEEFLASYLQKRRESAKKENERKEQTRQNADEKANEAARQKREKVKEERERVERIRKEREAKEAAEEERIRLERAREHAEREEQKKKEQECAEKKREEEEAKRKREAENAASNERIGQRAKERAENAAREKREKEEKEQAEWDQAWTKYQDQWTIFKTSSCSTQSLRDAIPWPVKSGSFRDVHASGVKEFLVKALPKSTLPAKLLRKECQKWHPDAVGRWPRAMELTDVERIMLDMICRVVTDLLNASSRRSSEFL